MAAKILQCFSLFLIFIIGISLMATVTGESLCRKPTQPNIINLLPHNYAAAYVINQLKYLCYNVEELQLVLSRNVTFKTKVIDNDLDYFFKETGVQKVSSSNVLTIEVYRPSKVVIHVHVEIVQNNIVVWYLCEGDDLSDEILIMYDRAFITFVNLIPNVDEVIATAAYNKAKTFTDHPENYKVKSPNC